MYTHHIQKPTWTHKYTHACIHAYIHTYIHTYTHLPIRRLVQPLLLTTPLPRQRRIRVSQWTHALVLQKVQHLFGGGWQGISTGNETAVTNADAELKPQHLFPPPERVRDTDFVFGLC